MSSVVSIYACPDVRVCWDNFMDWQKRDAAERPDYTCNTHKGSGSTRPFYVQLPPGPFACKFSFIVTGDAFQKTKQ